MRITQNADLSWDFTNRHVVVVGGATGIGAQVAVDLAAAGATVDLFDRKEPDSGRGGRFTQVDVRDPFGLKDAVRAITADRGPIDSLVYAVGVLDGYARLDESTDDLTNTVLDINVLGALRAIRAVVPGMKQHGFGRIVVFGSIAGQVAGAGGLPYTISKHALTGLVKHVAVELGPFGITVNAIAPGSISGTNIRTSITEVLATSVPSNQGLGTMNPQDVARSYPVGRLGSVDAVVPTLALLLGRESWFITGSTSVIDGGYLAQ